MTLLSELIGQDAVVLETAVTTGKVRGIRVRQNRITHVELSKVTIPVGAVRSFDGDVLTYDGAEVLPAENVTTSDPRQLLILDLDGNRLGDIEDLQIAPDGTIENILTKDDEIPGARLRTIGSFAAVCEAQSVAS
jgi:sporulation protein YlmC with PRC-barrel domain